MTDTNEVLVPVELLKELAQIVRFQKGSTPAGRAAEALIPKPKPRLVAFDYQAWLRTPVDLKEYVDAQADLLDTLDSVVDEFNDVWGVGDTSVNDLKAALREEFGVGHD